jgi:rRNA-processing protein FCF1
MKIVVTDVSVFFDLFIIQALPEFFELELEICTTDFVYNEIEQSEQKETFDLFITKNKLKILSFTEDEYSEVVNFKTKWSNRSLNDRTILWLALQLNSVLLTCDGKLKKEAEHHKIEVHGSLWVIEQLVLCKIITHAKGIELLMALRKNNLRLPGKEIEKLIKQWK